MTQAPKSWALGNFPTGLKRQENEINPLACKEIQVTKYYSDISTSP